MAINIEKTFDAEAIRDTSNHNGGTVFNGDFVIKTLIIENGLNQQVTLQCQASANSDFSNSFNVGSSFNVSAATNSYQTCDSYFPYWRLTAICGISPASGGLTCYVMGVRS